MNTQLRFVDGISKDGAWRKLKKIRNVVVLVIRASTSHKNLKAQPLILIFLFCGLKGLWISNWFFALNVLFS